MLFLCPGLACRAQGTLHIMAENYPPYSYPGSEGHAEGFGVDIVTEILRRTGTPEQDITIYPWARAYEMLERDVGLALLPMARSPERERIFKFVGPFFEDRLVFFKTRDSPLVIRSLADARRVGKIGVTRNDLAHSLLLAYNFENLDLSSGHVYDFRKLSSGHVDLAAMGEKVFRYFVRQSPELSEDMFEQTPVAFFELQSSIAFSPDVSDEMVLRWQEALNAMKEDGTHESIAAAYFLNTTRSRP